MGTYVGDEDLSAGTASKAPGAAEATAGTHATTARAVESATASTSGAHESGLRLSILGERLVSLQ